ncbi:MAG: hypothetical protein WCJ64_01095 [Rhodospirillaceae bacterium]
MRSRGWGAGLTALALIVTMSHPAPVLAAEAGGWASWTQPVVRSGLLYGTLYATAFAVSQSARLGIAAAAPSAWMGAAQTFGMPAAIVLVMSQAIPAFKQSIPEIVDRWYGTPHAAPILSSRDPT